MAAEITPHKPILAIKAGRTREGSVAVSSHTGTLVDQAAMATAMFRKAGVVEFHDTHEMIKAAIAFSTQPAPTGNRIGIITNTGGPGIQAVDESVEPGLELAKWSEPGATRLAESLYAEASLGNPVDVVATADADHYFAAVDTLLKEDGTDMVLVFFVTAPFVDLDAIARASRRPPTASDKPVVVVVETMRQVVRPDRQAARQSACRSTSSPRTAPGPWRAMARYGSLPAPGAGRPARADRGPRRGRGHHQEVRGQGSRTCPRRRPSRC